MLISGDDSLCQELLTRLSLTDEFKAENIRKAIMEAKKEFQALMDSTIEDSVLRPNLLNKAEYLKLLHGQSVTSEYVKGIARQVQEFEFECDVIFCGFDSKGRAFIQAITSPGKIIDATHQGFYAIGSGWEKAISRLLWMDSDKSDSIEKALYDSFDAKASAEMVPSVGYEWDARVVVKGSTDAPNIDELTKEAIERLWSRSNKSPYDKEEKELKIKGGPTQWKKIISSYASSIKQKR